MRAGLLVTAVLGVVAAPGAAAADHAHDMIVHFAGAKPDEVTAAHSLRLEGARPYTDVVAGTFRRGAWDHQVLILLRCTASACHGTSVSLGNHAFELRGLVDLAGEPGKLDGPGGIDLRHPWRRSLDAWGMKWPALIVVTREEKVTTGGSRFRGDVRGSERHHDLLVISLRKADLDAPRLARLATVDRYPSGAGTSTAYSLVRGPGKQRKGAALEILGEQSFYLEDDSACLPPRPIELRWRLREGRYQPAGDLLGRGGCR
jgi:hypothetical protein